MSLIADVVHDYLAMRCVEDLGYQEVRPGVFSVKVHAGEGAVGRRTIATTSVDLRRRMWLDCFYISEIDVSDLDAAIPEDLRSEMWIDPEVDAEGRRWAELYRTRPFDVSESEVSTAGIVSPDHAETIAEGFVVAPIESAFEGEIAPRWSTGGLMTIALTPLDGYRLHPGTWRTACVVLAAADQLERALRTLDAVAEAPRHAEDTDAEVRLFREWLSGADLASIAGWDLVNDGDGEQPRFPIPGEVRSARALWRYLGDGTVPATATSGPVLPLTDSFLGRVGIEEWLKGDGVLEAEFAVYDIRGTVGAITHPDNARLVERHLVDTFGSWARATRPEHRDLLDRYQRHVGDTVLGLASGSWVERRTPEGVLDPIVQLADGRIVDPTAVLVHALTTKTGDAHEHVLAGLGYRP